MQFLEEVLIVVPYKLHALLTDNGIQFAEQPRNRNTIISRMSRFDMTCEANSIEHRLTKPNHPWSEEDQATVRGTVGPTNGQVQRMNRTIKDATTKRCHDEDHERTPNSSSTPATMPAGSRPSRGPRQPSSSGKNGKPSLTSSTRSRAARPRV